MNTITASTAVQCENKYYAIEIAGVNNKSPTKLTGIAGVDRLPRKPSTPSIIEDHHRTICRSGLAPTTFILSTQSATAANYRSG